MVNMSTILDKVDVPADLKGLSIKDMEELAKEIRSMIVETLSETGGHMAANLGIVELTIALLKVFDLPTDKIVWDVGHQAYTYKILTGRKTRFKTLRQRGGISGFLKRSESEYDVFGAGHSGTAISAALGVAVARDTRAGSEHVVAVLGDGALGCGISLEALNNVHSTTDRLIVVLNDVEIVGRWIKVGNSSCVNDVIRARLRRIASQGSGSVREGNQLLSLCKGRERPRRAGQRGKTGQGKPFFEHVSPPDFIRHRSSPCEYVSATDSPLLPRSTAHRTSLMNDAKL